MRIVNDFDPDVVVVSGWNISIYKPLVNSRALKIIAIDNQRIPSFRQSVGRILKKGYLRQFDGIFVPGERSWQFARFLGFDPSRIIRGVYGIDYEGISQVASNNLSSEKGDAGFLFVGRLLPIKGIENLVKSYREYRLRVESPWPLRICGMGPLRDSLSQEEGVELLGFVQPNELAEVMSRHSCFVLPSSVEPWGQVIVEAAAAGLPILCSEECGASVELVENHYNGFKFSAHDSEALTEAMCYLHRHTDERKRMGQRSQHMAEAYSAQNWVKKFLWGVSSLRKKQN